MREIKFRAYEAVTNTMFYNLDYITMSGGAFCSRPLIRPVLMQYTGLKDKNGREIYEGDIVKYEDYSRGAFISFSGKDIQPCAIRAIKVENLFEGIYLHGFASMSKESKKIEVIGNIYENPELLSE